LFRSRWSKKPRGATDELLGQLVKFLTELHAEAKLPNSMLRQQPLVKNRLNHLMPLLINARGCCSPRIKICHGRFDSEAIDRVGNYTWKTGRRDGVGRDNKR